jgi:hypothetical protein
MLSINKTLGESLTKIAQLAIPELKEAFQITNEKNKDWDYSSPSCIKIFNMNKKAGSYGFSTVKDLATAIADKESGEDNVIKSIEILKAGSKTLN